MLNIALLILERLGNQIRRDGGRRRRRKSAKLVMLGRGKWEGMVQGLTGELQKGAGLFSVGSWLKKSTSAAVFPTQLLESAPSACRMCLILYRITRQGPMV